MYLFPFFVFILWLSLMKDFMNCFISNYVFIHSFLFMFFCFLFISVFLLTHLYIFIHFIIFLIVDPPTSRHPFSCVVLIHTTFAFFFFLLFFLELQNIRPSVDLRGRETRRLNERQFHSLSKAVWIMTTQEKGCRDIGGSMIKSVIKWMKIYK